MLSILSHGESFMMTSIFTETLMTYSAEDLNGEYDIIEAR